MKAATYEAETIEGVGGLDASLDRSCKKIVASKQIVSRIMQAVIPEYMDSTVEDIIPLIGRISIGDAPVDKDIPPVIINEDTEDNSIYEGKRLYDIKFTARTPQNDTIAMIINIEVQNNFSVGYPLIKRAEYYAARMISSQYGTVFTRSQYDKIQKVYTVWICTTPDKRHENTISLYKFHRETLAGQLADTAKDIQNYDLMNIIMICLGDSHTTECRGIIRMLYTMLSKSISAEEKKRIAGEEYNIPMVREFEEEVEHMCNISQKVRMEGYNSGVIDNKREMVIEMAKKKLPVEMIAEIARLSIEETEAIIKSGE